MSKIEQVKYFKSWPFTMKPKIAFDSENKNAPQNNKNDSISFETSTRTCKLQLFITVYTRV